MKDEISSLNLSELDVEELEHRLHASSISAEDGWGCDVNCSGCTSLACCSYKPEE
jgi:hypothetical protein